MGVIKTGAAVFQAEGRACPERSRRELAKTCAAPGELARKIPFDFAQGRLSPG